MHSSWAGIIMRLDVVLAKQKIWLFQIRYSYGIIVLILEQESHDEV